MSKKSIFIKLVISILFFTSLIFQGCVANKKSSIPISSNFNSNDSCGVVIGTVTFVYPKKKSPFTSYHFHLSYNSEDVEEAKNNSTYFNIKVNFFNGRFNGALNEKKTFPFILIQKPGKYFFDGFWFFWNGGLISQNIYNRVSFSLPFEVVKGKISYIGDINVNLKSQSYPFIEIKNNFFRDLSFFKNRYNQIDWELAINRTLHEGNNGDGFIKLN